MKTNKLWWNMLVALMLPLSFALTSCGDDDDDDDKGSTSGSLARTAWYGDAEDTLYYVDFEKDGEFSMNATDGSHYYYGEYKVSSGTIKFRYISGSDNNLREGSYDYKIRGRKGEREMVIYDVFRGGVDLYLEEIDYEGSGSDDDWDEDW